MTALAGRHYVLGPQLARDSQVSPYVSRQDMPVDWRWLRVFAVDPSLPSADGEVHDIRVPYEPLDPGPTGGLFGVDMTVGDGGTCYRRVDLDDPALLRSRGVEPDEEDACFHGQMLYGIASLNYEAFRKALGRQPAWAFDNRYRDRPNRLTLVPFGMKEANACYSRERREVRFGYVRSGEKSNGDVPPEKTFFTSLSSDIVTHEVTHAILDGLRPYLREPTGPDVPAFHEAFADLMAIFQRFEFEPFVRAQLRGARGDISMDSLLNVIAPELGQVTGKPFGIRRFMARHGDRRRTEDRPVTLDDVGEEEHARGAVLAEAVFEAFVTIARRRTAPLVRLATGGRERLEDGELSAELLDAIVGTTCKVADQFRRICIRAIDYCPPVDLTFGDYLRGMVTADRSLVREDPYDYREALVNAFRRRKIYPNSVTTMSQHSLLWNRPERRLAPIAALNLGNLRFDGDPGGVPRGTDTRYHATCLGDAIVADPALFAEIGLIAGDEAGPVEIASLRPTRRSGPDGQIAFALIAEVVQTRHVPLPDGRRLPMRGGATLIFNAWGRIQLIIRKGLGADERERRIVAYTTGAGARYWTGERDLALAAGVFRNFCVAGTGEAEAEPDSGDVSARDVVGKTWVLVENPPGVETGHRVLVGGALPLRTGSPQRVAPGVRNEYRLVREDGIAFSTRVAAPSRTRANPFAIRLVREG